MTKYFVDLAGNYIGAFEGAEPPVDSMEVPSAPADARQVWEGGEWSAVISPVPTSVTPRQIRQALTRVNLRADVEAAVAASSQDMKDWWEFATSIERDNPEVIAMGQALGVSVMTLDNLFVLASTL